jgi:multidrug efflux system outer membrane protein
MSDTLSVPGTWSLGLEATQSSPSAHPVAFWWQELGDSELNNLVTMALTNNANVAVAAARVRQARAQAEEARATRLPRLDLAGAMTRERVSQSSLRDTEGERQTIAAYHQSRFSSQLVVSYELDLLGRLALGEKAALINQAASNAELRAVRQWLARELILAYADVRLADDRATAAHQASALLMQLRVTEQERLKAGLIGRDRQRAAEREAADQEDALAAVGQERHAARTRLAELLGKAPTEVDVPEHADYFAQLVLSGALAPNLPATVLEQRADVAAAWQRVLGASAQAERVHLERYPSLTLTGSTGFISEIFRRWLTGDAVAWVAQAVLQSPLLDGGRAEARSEQAVASLDEQYAQYRKVALQALAETEAALFATQAARARVTLASVGLARREADREAVSAALRAGISSHPALLQAELNHLAAAVSLSQRRYELLVRAC